MVSVPTRSRFIEDHLMRNDYGVLLIRQLDESFRIALTFGRTSVRFTFDSASLADPRKRAINGLFVEHLKIKKYRVNEEGMPLGITVGLK